MRSEQHRPQETRRKPLLEGVRKDISEEAGYKYEEGREAGLSKNTFQRPRNKKCLGADRSPMWLQHEKPERWRQ